MEPYQHPTLGTIYFRCNKRAKRVILRVKANKGIFVTLPSRASYKIGLDLVNQNIDWIQQQQKKIAKKSPAFDYHTKYQIRDKQLSIIPTREEKAYLTLSSPEQIDLGIPLSWNIKEAASQQVIIDLLIHALRVEGKGYLPQRTRSIAQQKGITINIITIKKVKTRWGSCSNKKNINLSLYLMLLPDNLIDYVIYHELAHIRHQDHSPAFWQHLEDLLPGAKALDKALKKYRIPF